MRARASVALVACLSAAVFAAAQTARPGAFAIGVMRRDGIIVPFADFDGKRWRANWPAPKEQVDVPIQLRNVPSGWWGKIGPRETWQVWIAAQPAATVRVRQPDWFEAQCWKQIGLRTDYRSAEPPPDPGTQPFPKDGLAVSPALPIERIDVVPIGHLLPQPVVDAFNKAEEQAIRDERQYTARLPTSRTHRESITPKIEAIYGVGDPTGTRAYYVELSKEYADRRPAVCPTVVFGAGWFVRDGAAPLRKLRFDAEVVDCERYGLLYMLPLGAIRLLDRLYWIAQWSGWDYEEYGVVEIKPKGVEDVIQVVGGRC